MVNQVVVEVVDYKEGVVDYKGELVDKETILHLSYLGQVEPCSPFEHCKKYLVYTKMCHLAKPIFFSCDQNSIGKNGIIFIILS